MDNVPTRGEFIKLTDQIKADQRLRDAAPELLEACKGLLECLNGWDGYPSPYWVQMQAAKAAIAKAQPTEINETI